MSGTNDLKVIVRQAPEIKVGMYPPRNIDGEINVNVENQPDIRILITQPQITAVMAPESFILFAEYSISSSFAAVSNFSYSSSYAQNAFPYTGSAQITGSLHITGSQTISQTLVIGGTVSLGSPETPLNIVDGSSGSILFLSGSGELGIGISTPLYKLHVSGEIFASGDIIAFSDRRIKTDIKSIRGALSLVNKLQGVGYTRIDDITPLKKQYIGFIAQDVKKVLPEVVFGTEKDGYGVSYGNITALLVEAIKELDYKVGRLEYMLNN